MRDGSADCAIWKTQVLLPQITKFTNHTQLIRTQIEMIRSQFESVLTQAAGRFQPVSTSMPKGNGL